MSLLVTAAWSAAATSRFTPRCRRRSALTHGAHGTSRYVCGGGPRPAGRSAVATPRARMPEITRRSRLGLPRPRFGTGAIRISRRDLRCGPFVSRSLRNRDFRWLRRAVIRTGSRQFPCAALKPPRFGGSSWLRQLGGDVGRSGHFSSLAPVLSVKSRLSRVDAPPASLTLVGTIRSAPVPDTGPPAATDFQIRRPCAAKQKLRVRAHRWKACGGFQRFGLRHSAPHPG